MPRTEHGKRLVGLCLVQRGNEHDDLRRECIHEDDMSNHLSSPS